MEMAYPYHDLSIPKHLGSDAKWSLGPPPLPRGKFLWKPGNWGKSSHLPDACMAHGYRAAFLLLSHTSLHFCKCLGDAR